MLAYRQIHFYHVAATEPRYLKDFKQHNARDAVQLHRNPLPLEGCQFRDRWLDHQYIGAGGHISDGNHKQFQPTRPDPYGFIQSQRRPIKRP